MVHSGLLEPGLESQEPVLGRPDHRLDLWDDLLIGQAVREVVDEPEVPLGCCRSIRVKLAGWSRRPAGPSRLHTRG